MKEDEIFSKRVLYCLMGGGVCICGGGVLYLCNVTHVPITNRRAYIFFSFNTELEFQDYILDNLLGYANNENGATVNGDRVISDSTDIRYRLVHRVVKDIQRACVYFDPSCEEYMNHMKILVVDSPEVNAFSSVGGIIVVYTGIVVHYVQLEAEGKVQSAEECIAGVVAHELAHSIARHSLESNTHWSVIVSYLAMFLLSDVFITPQIAKMVENTLSRKLESEADFMAMYLLKRAGYDIHQFGRTLGLLETDDIDPAVLRFFSLFEDHPSTVDRENRINECISKVDKDFETLYSVEKKSPSDRMSKGFARGMDNVWALMNLFL